MTKKILTLRLATFGKDLEDDYHEPDFLKSYEGRGQSVETKEGEQKTVPLKIIPSPDDQP
jgi:hypothetical protein